MRVVRRNLLTVCSRPGKSDNQPTVGDDRFIVGLTRMTNVPSYIACIFLSARSKHNATPVMTE